MINNEKETQLNVKIKICNTCYKEKQINEFHNNKNKVDGKQKYCKECAKTFQIKDMKVIKLLKNNMN